jgi:quinol monooxygenase YgiN
MQPKFNLTATLYAKSEKRAELLKLLTSFVDKSRSEQGCVDYHFHISLDDPNMFYFYENWAERADFDRHIALDYQKDWFAKQGDYLAKPVELRFFEMVKIPDDRIGQVVQDYAARDVEVTQTGQFVADFHFYLDTEPKLDFVYELGNCPYQDLPPDLVSIYPPEESAPKRA